MSTTSISAAVTDVGLRENNQDSCFADDALGLYIVADGVGGRQAGDVASAMAVQVRRDTVAAWRADVQSRDPAWVVMQRAMESACATVHREATEKRALAGMSTTLTAVLIEGDKAIMGHVGDSRLFLLRNGVLEQISTDHTLAAELYRGGAIARETVPGHPHSRVLTRNVGSQAAVMVESLLLEVHPGDSLLLCSDGLNPALEPPEHVVDVLEGSHELEPALRGLIERAKEAGSRDNITAVVWRHGGGGEGLSRPVVEALCKVPIFATLSLADLARVADDMTIRQHAAGEVLIEHGNSNGALHVVLDGRLRWELPGGHFAHLERGSGIGATTLVASRHCPATLSAEVDTQVIVLETEVFRSLCKRRPRLGTQLLIALADELSDWIDPETDRGVAQPPAGLLVEY